MASDLAATAKQLGIKYFLISFTDLFGVHGANSEDLFTAALRHGGLRVTVSKHEFGAGAMADGVFRITGRPACVLTTSGGGAMNVLPALAEAYESRVPILALIGCALPAYAQTPKPQANVELNRAWAAGYRAGFVCSSLWNGGGKPLDAIERDELTGI